MTIKEALKAKVIAEGGVTEGKSTSELFYETLTEVIPAPEETEPNPDPDPDPNADPDPESNGNETP